MNIVVGRSTPVNVWWVLSGKEAMQKGIYGKASSLLVTLKMGFQQP